MNPSQSTNKTSRFPLQDVNTDNPIKLLLLTYNHPLLFCCQIQTALLNTTLDTNKHYCACIVHDNHTKYLQKSDKNHFVQAN